MTVVSFTMPKFARRCAAALAAASALVVLPAGVGAQAFNYPSLQLPSASIRDYTAAVAGGNATTLLFQWRESAGEGMHFGLDAGLSDSDRRNNLLAFFGVSGGREFLRATAEQPLDLLGTLGAGLAFGGGTTVVRVPVGVSVGHTFELDQGMSLTPYVHPRVSLDVCGDCSRGNGSKSELTLNFDLGANFQVSRQFAVRAAAVFSGSDFVGNGDSFTIGFNWTPSALAPSR